MPKRRDPKRQWTQQKKHALEVLGKKRLTPTKTQRRQARENFYAIYGYYPARLSMAVGRIVNGVRKPGKASSYRVAAKRPIYNVEKVRIAGQRTVRTNIWGEPKRDVWGDIIYDHTPDKVVVRKKLVGETLVVKRVRKGKTGKKGSTRGEGQVRLGSAKAIKGKAKHRKAGKKGARANKEKMKAKKKKQ